MVGCLATAVDVVATDRVTGLDVVKRIARNNERGAEGLPLGVQIVAPHWREDVVLAVMRAVENSVNFQSYQAAR